MVASGATQRVEFALERGARSRVHAHVDELQLVAVKLAAALSERSGGVINAGVKGLCCVIL